MAKRKFTTQIDNLLSQLTEEGRQEFADFVSVDRKLIDIQRWWSERGFSVSITVVHTWRSHHRQEGQRAKAVHNFIKQAKGIRAIDLLEYIACESAFAVSEARDALDQNGYNKEDMMILLGCFKEARSNAIALNEAQVRGDRTQDILSGAYELARKALTACKDHPNEQFVEDLLNGELKATEDELRREQLGDT